MRNEHVRKTVLSGFFLTLCLLLPLLTGQIKELGDTLLPMHLPAMLCGLVCGKWYGFAVGLSAPILRGVIFGMPPLYPSAIWMSLELATYGFVIGFLYSKVKKKDTPSLILCLVASMICGRIVWGVTKFALLSFSGGSFGLALFFTQGFGDALLGIAIQLVLIPAIIKITDKIMERSFNSMKKVFFPFGKEHIEHGFGKELIGVLESGINKYDPHKTGDELIQTALENPVGSPRLSTLAKGKQNVVIIASDHTRPVPSKLIIPKMLKEIREGSPNCNITILIATGCHRGTTKEELVSKFGNEIVEKENIYIHDCDEKEKLVSIGTLPSGGECIINRIATDADLLVSEGFIEPHFFAGFSGGRKSVLPGICARQTVLANHCSEFIDNEKCRTGILDGNPMHEDMVWAADKAKLAFIVNVVLNDKKDVIFATAGHFKEAHQKGTEFLRKHCGVLAREADVVITTNGGYPLDQNVYQAVKGMTAGEATVKKDGIIIMLAKSNDGIGGEHFYNQLISEADIGKTMELFLSRGRNETVPDQWQTQVLLRVLQHARVIYISDMEDSLVEKMHLIPAHSIDEAIEMAKRLLNKDSLEIVAIPDGVSVIVEK